MANGSPLHSKQEAFDLLFEANRGAVFSFFLGHLSDREDAKDQTQETFSRVWLRVEDVLRIATERRRFWIFAVAQHVLIDYRRRSGVRRAAITRIAAEVLGSRPLQAVVEDRIAIQALDCAIAGLPEDRRIVLTMTVVGGMTSDEIGGVIGKKPSTVRSILLDARRRLSRAMNL